MDTSLNTSLDTIYCASCDPDTTGLKITLGTDYGASADNLPPADFLVITWTDSETGALAKILGGGKYSFDSLDVNNFTKLNVPHLPLPSGMTQAEASQGYFFAINVNGKSVICLRSNFHPKFGDETNNTAIFFRSIAMTGTNANYGYIITSGTAGGVWPGMDVGDVAVAVKARFGLLAPSTLQGLPTYTSLVNPIGASSAPGNTNWFDYANKNYLANASCVITGLHSGGGRKDASNPVIYYQGSGGNILCSITDTELSQGHTTEGDDLAKYRTIGSTLDENDAFLARAWNQVGFRNWVSIRNVSDLPDTTNNEQYEEFGYCSSLNGAYAIWAFIMGR